MKIVTKQHSSIHFSKQRLTAHQTALLPLARRKIQFSHCTCDIQSLKPSIPFGQTKTYRKGERGRKVGNRKCTTDCVDANGLWVSIIQVVILLIIFSHCQRLKYQDYAAASPLESSAPNNANPYIDAIRGIELGECNTAVGGDTVTRSMLVKP